MNVDRMVLFIYEIGNKKSTLKEEIDIKNIEELSLS